MSPQGKSSHNIPAGNQGLATVLLQSRQDTGNAPVQSPQCLPSHSPQERGSAI